MASTPETFTFEDDGTVPNSPLPVLVYHDIREARDAGDCERLFAQNGWLGAWQNGIYPFHHYHSISHEVLGIVRGTAAVTLGGPEGQLFELEQGDVVVLPAGTGHCKLDDHDLLVVGAYPQGMDWDLCRASAAEHDAAVRRIRQVPLPGADPVGGPNGALTQSWR